MKFGRFSVTDYVLIEYGKGKFVSVMPVKEREFAGLLEKRIRELTFEEKETDKRNKEERIEEKE